MWAVLLYGGLLVAFLGGLALMLGLVAGLGTVVGLTVVSVVLVGLGWRRSAR